MGQFRLKNLVRHTTTLYNPSFNKAEQEIAHKLRLLGGAGVASARLPPQQKVSFMPLAGAGREGSTVGPEGDWIPMNEGMVAVPAWAASEACVCWLWIDAGAHLLTH